MKSIRLLKPNEIDVRVGTINEKGATLLLYKDARVDMNILDETYPNAWKRTHELINGNLFCTISVWNDDLKEWIPRQDVGVESNTEKEKGQASDAFKRAGFNFGIGRELYTAPFTWVSSEHYNSYKNPKTGKLGTYDKFIVTDIGYDDNKEINFLLITNTKTGKTVFTLRNTSPKSTNVVRDRHEEAQDADSDKLDEAKKDINGELINQNYTRADDKKAFIKFAIGKDTIDSIEEAREVAKALEINNEP